MQTLIKSLVFSLLAIVLVNCKQQTALNKEQSTTETDSLIFSYQRTACFGECPVYSIEVYKSGYTHWEGKIYTERLGHYVGTTDKVWLNNLLNEAKEIGFFDLPDKIETNITDFPSKIIYFNLNGKKKEVNDPSAGPDALRALQKKIEIYFENLALKEIKK